MLNFCIEHSLYIGRGFRLGVSPAPHLAFGIFTPFNGFFFLLRHPALRLFASSTGFLLLSCAQLAHLFLGGVVLGCVGTHRRWPPSYALATPTLSLGRSLPRGRGAQTKVPGARPWKF